jgi:DNA-binding transcriptional ArsR family regulator
METFRDSSNLFKVLSHPIRLAVLYILRDGEQCVCHMEALLGLRQSAISQQLMVLREAGLIEDRREGWNIFYRVVKPQVYEILDQVCSLAGSDPQEFSALKAPAACPCPKCNSSESVKIFTEQMKSKVDEHAG